MATKTLSVRMKDEEYRFLSALAEEEREDVSTTLRELLEKGRVLLAIEKYRRAEASLEKAARLAGVSMARMMDVLREYGVELNLESEDYQAGLARLRKAW
jgi:predicted HTH domain antitoxin